MAAFGKLSNSLSSVASNNTLALLHVNINFSLISCDPSPEYTPIGLALTKQRKEDAEHGSIHSTACQLGFLFHELIPPTPKLLRGYGIRTSEILSHPGINPQGTERDGPFQAFIGADCTSIWAAATCGPASVAVLLLACMLARAWDPKQAISIWVELVEDRRRKIREDVSNNKIVHPHTMAAAQQAITRSQLAEWDASARSWLRRADLFMARNHTQFNLVIKNLALPYSPTGSTFEKVTASWIGSMEVVESLMGNFPQQASDRAVLLALSSWHMYPDLLVFQQEARQIPFQDSLFPNAGILSLGLEYKVSAQNVTQWSLALSHLRCYGDPVHVTSHEDLGRVHIDNLWLVVLGALLRRWGVSYTKFGIAVAWFQDLHKVLSSCGSGASCPELSWLKKICAAAAGEITTSASESWIKYGWRRSTIFPKDSEAIHKPFFGLCNEHTIQGMSQKTDIDCGIVYTRSLTRHFGFTAHQALVLYTGVRPDGATYMEWATISPIESHLGEWSEQSTPSNASGTSTRTNVRWIYQEGDSHNSSFLHQRRSEIEDMGEICHVISRDFRLRFHEENNKFEYRWENPPGLFCMDRPVDFTWIQMLRSDCRDRFQMLVLSNQYHDLWDRSERNINDKIEAASASVVPMDEGRRHLCQTFSPERVIDYLVASLDVSCDRGS